MSLRPHISGFDLGTMTAFIGCGDRIIAARAEAHMRTPYSSGGDLAPAVGDENLDAIAASEIRELCAATRCSGRL